MNLALNRNEFVLVRKPTGKSFKPEYIMKMTTNKNFTNEVGGKAQLSKKRTRNGNQKISIRFVNTAPGLRHKTGRKAVNIANNRQLDVIDGFTFHTHPFESLWWPSIEDMLATKMKTSILVSKHGFWTYKKLNGTVDNNLVMWYTNKLGWHLLNDVPTKTHDGKPVSKSKYKEMASNVISHWMKDMKTIGIEVFFFWNDQIDKVKKDLETYLSRDAVKYIERKAVRKAKRPPKMSKKSNT